MTACSALESRVCCTPQPAKGSLRFARAASPSHPKAARLVGVRSPQRGSHPSKISPRQQPFRITAAVAFLPLPSCPARVPTEAGVLADRRVPRRATYIRGPCRGGPGRPAPRGGGSGVRRRPNSAEARRPAPRRVPLAEPRERGPAGVERAGLRGASSARSRGGGADPTRLERGRRTSEEARSPCPGEALRAVRRSAPFAVPRWGGVPTTPKGRWFPVPVELAGRCAEARRLPCPGGAGSPVLRGARGSLPRRGAAGGAPKRAVADPGGSGPCPDRGREALAR